MRKPLVTYAGDPQLFKTVLGKNKSFLSEETVEWRRSYGRPARSVNVDVEFTVFSEDCACKAISRNILGQPIFHTYWLECADVETYKAVAREALQAWASCLRSHDITEWMVILVETSDTKKSNKLLPRTTVLDKVKNDFGGKQGERCVSLLDPLKSDSRSAESLNAFLIKLRHLIMLAYNRSLNKFEENMRLERERRTEKNWSFCSYFILQEELAQVYELLSLHDEALVQYDELDALFTQFLLNSVAGDVPGWLSSFRQGLESWEGLHLTSEINLSNQDEIKNEEISLLSFRNYLFQRQASHLIHLERPWEVATRGLSFLHNVVAELQMLDVVLAPGGVSCWGFLSCLEIVNKLRAFKEPNNTDVHALHTAPLWAYAREKLLELGELCGLMPGVGQSSSEKLHMVISLVYGMGNDPHSDEELTGKMVSPMTRLKEALSSREAFKRHFLDISEVAISTYKHIGRLRSARLIGRSLASFYMQLNEPHKALPFLIDQLKTFMEEKWELLIADTQVELARCYLATCDIERFIKVCAQMMASAALPKEKKLSFFGEMMKNIDSSSRAEKMLIPCGQTLFVKQLKNLTIGSIVPHIDVETEVTIVSLFPLPIWCESITLGMRHSPEKDAVAPSLNRRKASEIERKSSSSSSSSIHHIWRNPSMNHHYSRINCDPNPQQLHESSVTPEVEEEDSKLRPLQMRLNLEYKQDKSLSSAYVMCSNTHPVLRRLDSQGGFIIDQSVAKDAYEDTIAIENVTVQPGVNKFLLTSKFSRKGHYTAEQVVFSLPNCEFISNKDPYFPKFILYVVDEPPKISFSSTLPFLLAGIPQPMVLSIHAGSCRTDAVDIKIVTSKGLLIAADSEEDPQKRELALSLPDLKPFNNIELPINVLANFISQKDSGAIEHFLHISSSFLDFKMDADLHFLAPFMSSLKLHTATTRKFIQININGLVSTSVELSNPCLEVRSECVPVTLKDLNIESHHLIINSEQNASYMWEASFDYSLDETPPVVLEFSVDYALKSFYDKGGIRKYVSKFDLHNYKTLFTIRAKVEPNKGSEFCRAGGMCHLNIVVQKVLSDVKLPKREAVLPGSASSPCPQSTSHSGPSSLKGESIMYEVLADQAMWAVCGRTSGILSMDAETRHSVTLDVMPLAGGFLPLPSVRLSKYIPAEPKPSGKESGKKFDIVGSASSVSRLEPFSTGQVYNYSKSQQVHVLPAIQAGTS